MQNLGTIEKSLTESAYIGLGSNLGDGLITLQQAWQAIGEEEGVTPIALSAPYLSEPVGMESSNWFTNCVGHLKTELSAHDLLHHLLQVEANFGRRRDANVTGYQDRTLDLDIIYYAQLILQDEDLLLPHPQMAERLFVLQPLVEIAPDFNDPRDGVTVRQKLENLQQRMSDGTLSQQQITRGEWSRSG